MPFLAELKRRKVLRTAAIYIAMSWVVLQAAELLLGMFDAPPWGLKLVFAVLVVGLPIALVLSWTHRLTLHGFAREIEALQGTEAGQPDALPAPAPSATSPPPAHSIAVLPFANMSEDASNEYFADGLSEELLNLLARIPALQVIARTSSFSFKGKGMSAAAIARELNVAHLLEGSVRRSGQRLRIAAQLVRASDSTQIWSQSFDRNLGDIFAVQDEIACAVVNELEIHLLGAVAPKAPVADPRAYALYLEGRHFFELYSSSGYEQALAAFNEAIAIDPRFAPVWANLGALYWSGANNRLIDYDEGARKARDASVKALVIDPQHAEALSLLGILDVVEQTDAEQGIRRTETALALEPNNQRVLTRAGIVARRRGHLDEAIEYAERALRSDPLSANAYASLGFCYYLARRFEEAETMRRKVLELSPGWLSGHYYLARVLLARHDVAGALREVELEPSRLWRLVGLAIVNHALGRSAASDAALVELKHLNTTGIAYQIAEVHAFRGEVDAAFEWLERSLTTHDSGLMDSATDPLLAKLRGDARWVGFLGRAGVVAPPA